MLNIAVCDDEEMVLPYLCEQISSAFERVHMEVRIDSYSSSIKLRKTIENRISYDVFFLDIDMEGLDGFRLASFIENKLEEAVLIFVSSKEEYVFSSFRHHPFSFIRKEKLRHFPTILLFLPWSSHTIKFVRNFIIFREIKIFPVRTSGIALWIILAYFIFGTIPQAG